MSAARPAPARKEAPARRSLSIPGPPFDPFRALWRLFTSVRFAIWLIATIAIACFLGVVLPQVPLSIRDDPARIGEWVDRQEDRFGPLAEPMYRLGLFEVFSTYWFQAGLAVLAVAVAVCVGNRWAPTWRTMRHGQKRVSQAYLRHTRHRTEFATPADPSAIERALRKRRYRVQRFEDADAVRLFAERFQWAYLGTFMSHLALIIFIVGGLVTVLTSFEARLFIAEGQSAPVFGGAKANQMQVQVDKAVGRFDSQGRPLDYRSFIRIFRGGELAKACVTTVNDPCTFAGYRFSQAAFFGFGAALQVRDTGSGRIVYEETLGLSTELGAPQVAVHDASGQRIFEGTLLLDRFLGGTPVTALEIPGTGRTFLFGLRQQPGTRNWPLLVSEQTAGSQGNGTRVLDFGTRASIGGLTFTYDGLRFLPAGARQDVPRPAGEENPNALLFQMANAFFGSPEASSGEAVDVPGPGALPTLYIAGLGDRSIELRQGEKATVGNLEYTFLGQRPFAGIQVKRDQGAYFFWVAVGLLVVGMVVTFHVPRRRLWVEIGPERTYMGGLANLLAGFGRELRGIAREAGGTGIAGANEEDEDD